MEIVLSSYADAKKVLHALADIVEQYGVATRHDLKDLVGLQTDYSDNRYGWTNVDHVKITNKATGWVLELPESHDLHGVY